MVFFNDISDISAWSSMETVAATQLPPLPDPSASQWNQLDICAVPSDVDYSSFEEGLLQRVRDLHTKVENYLKALPVNEKCIRETVKELVKVDCPLPAKFTKVNVVDLIKKNKNIRVRSSCSSLKRDNF